MFLYEKVYLNRKNESPSSAPAVTPPSVTVLGGNILFFFPLRSPSPKDTLYGLQHRPIDIIKTVLFSPFVYRLFKKLNFFPVLQQYNVLFFIFTKVVFYHSIFKKDYFK